MKYPIKKEFFPFSHMTPPVQSPEMAGFLGSLMRTPKSIMRDTDVSVTREYAKSYDGADVELLIFSPRAIASTLPCLVYYHGGGFFFGAAWYHYKIAKRYAMETPCRVVFVQYRLAPKNPHPTPSEDSYAALKWTYDNAERLGIDRDRIAVGGDSAGGALAAAVCQMARDRGTNVPLFQMLIYPVTDRRMQTESNLAFVDTPMWNSRLSKKMWQGYVKDENDIAYASPMEASSFEDLGAAYVEVAEFDCLRDEGKAYANALMSAGSDVEINETSGTIHGFDAVESAPTSKAAVASRIAYMQRNFYGVKRS